MISPAKPIAFLVGDFPKASETFVSRELTVLQRLGIEATPISFRRPDSQASLGSRMQAIAAATHYISNRTAVLSGAIQPLRFAGGILPATGLHRECMFKSNPLMRLLRALAVGRQMKALGIDHVHSHWPYATQVAWLLHNRYGFTVSTSIHAHEVEYDWGHFPRVFKSLSFAGFCNRAAMQRLLARLPEEAHQKCHLIYHGVDLESFQPLPHPPETSTLHVVSAGRMTTSKGFDRLIRGCARARELGAEVHLTILGDGSLMRELKLLAASLSFIPHLSLPGWLPHDQVSSCMARSHVFALLANADFNDGLPNVVLEAMATARTVILSPLPAATEAVSDGVEGFILDSPVDTEGLAQRLLTLSNAPTLVRTMGLAARNRVERDFDQLFHGAALARLLTSITSSRK